MKLISVIFCTLLLQASASFFDDITGAFASVENSFSKLLTDVVSDVKVTIDCTIMAVEQTLSIGGMFDTASEYEKRCKGENSAATDVRQSSYQAQPQQTTVAAVVTKKKSNTQEVQANVKKELQQAINDSISLHNETLEMFKERHNNAKQKIDNAKDTLKNDTIRLTQATNLLGLELDNLTAIVRNDINSYHVVPNKTSLDNVLTEVKLLYEIEDSNKNSTQANKIDEVLSEVLQDLHDNNTNAAGSTDDEFKEIMRDLEDTSNNTFIDIETQLSQWKDDEKKHLADIKLLIENKSDESEAGFPKSFRDVTRKILDEIDSVETQTEATVVTDSPASKPSEKPTPEPITTNKQPDLDADLINSYFAKDFVPREVAAKEAADVMEQSEYAQDLMDSLYGSNNNNDAINLFDNPALFGF